MHSQYKRNSVMIDLREKESIAAASVKPTVAAASDSNINLLLKPSLNSNFYLSPSSACTTKFNLQRRRNSYAAASSINKNDNMIMSSESSRNSGSTHFLDPSMATVCRRRLPPTPTSIMITDKKADTTNNSYIIRRSSSSRILPTPPPHSPSAIAFYSYKNTPNIDTLKLSPQSSIKQINEFSSNDFKYSTLILLERRPSTGRRLPPEPNTNINNNNNKNNKNNNNLQLNNENDTSIDNIFLLQRSASARGLQQFQTKMSQLPPIPINSEQIDENNVNKLKCAFSLSTTSENYLSQSINQKVINKNHQQINSNQISPCLLNTLNIRTNEKHCNVETLETYSVSLFDNRLPASDIVPNNISSKKLIKNLSTSASQSPCSSIGSVGNSPRIADTQMCVSSRNNIENKEINSTTKTKTTTTIIASTTKSPSSSSMSSEINYIPSRKYSDTIESSLGRNGSMAFLLEQQNLLRKEFCGVSNNADSSVSATRSNSSSLSLSIEQLNCATIGSKSGSDTEETSTCIDARMHGIDPSLYMAGCTKINTSISTSSFSNKDSLSQLANGNALSMVSGTHASTSWNSLPSSCSQSDSNITTCNSATPSSSVNDSTALIPQPRPRGLGLIYCTLQHFPIRKRLRVSVLKIEGLAGELRPDLEIQPFCKVNLLPGKQKQLSVVKRGRDAVFNQEFFFDNITVEELDKKSLNIEVSHQSAQKLQKDLEIGEVLVPLKDLTQLSSKKEVRIVEELKYSKLGKIYLTTCIEKEARRLTINLIKVDDLPKWGIIGAPDVCVRITLSQSLAPSQTKSSRVLKSTTCAVYKEAVMFLISTNKSDLQHTRIAISVHDLSRSVTGDDVIGLVYLGELAIDKSETEQWRQTIEHWGKEYKGCHHLKVNRQNAPNVHVSEMQSDNEDNEYE